MSVATKVFTATVNQEGDNYTMNVEFHTNIDVNEALNALGILIRGVAETGVKLAKAKGGTEADAVELMGL